MAQGWLGRCPDHRDLAGARHLLDAVGRKHPIIASTLPSSPVTSTMTERSLMSTILARKMSTICMISARLEGSAVTLINASSRATMSSSVRSLTLSTSTSLWSCLVICSSSRRSPVDDHGHARDAAGLRVVPTARLSMLKPRRVKSAATRARTPAWFSTRIERVCFTSAPPGGPLPFPSILQPASVDCAAGGIIGKTLSSGSTRKSRRTGPSRGRGLLQRGVAALRAGSHPSRGIP